MPEGVRVGSKFDDLIQESVKEEIEKEEEEEKKPENKKKKKKAKKEKSDKPEEPIDEMAFLDSIIGKQDACNKPDCTRRNEMYMRKCFYCGLKFCMTHF